MFSGTFSSAFSGSLIRALSGALSTTILSRLIGAVLLLLFCGCSSTPVPSKMALGSLFQDNQFKEVGNIPEPAELFALPPEAVQLLKGAYSRSALMSNQELAHEWLADYIHADKGGFRYQDNYTRTAAETFHDRAGNCMSLVILTAAMAQQLGIEVEFRDVEVPPVWDRQGAFYLVNGHINLKLYPPKNNHVFHVTERSILVDFLPERAVRSYKVNKISQGTVVAMYYNNAAAEALINENWDLAYGLLKRSLQQQSLFIPALNSLAVLYRARGMEQMAERVYRYALTLEPENMTTLYNLAVMLSSQDRLDEWAEVHKVLELARIRNPYYYYDMAQQAYMDHQYDEALSWYRRAIEKADYRHEFYFGLSRTYWAKGDSDRAKSNLQKALALAGDGEQKKRYQAKLHAMEGH
ncbi:hypothetical protein [Shewanella carassii]|nr:hypothetical protein [Shewanella carassii]